VAKEQPDRFELKVQLAFRSGSVLGRLRLLLLAKIRSLYGRDVESA
jgi:hypothetical protein